MPFGYSGRLLKVNLFDLSTAIEEIDGSLYRNYLGGSGLGAHWLYYDYYYRHAPLHPEQPLIFIAGLLTGTMVPTACKTSVCGRSPQTGIWSEATVGGFWGQQLRGAGYDAIIITGKAEKPVYLWLSEEGALIRPAGRFMGMDTYAASDEIRKETDPKAQVACIGPAGENLVNLASIMIGGHEGRAAGRCGLGALMGSKNLKAVAVFGRKKVELHDADGLKESVRASMKGIKEATVGLTNFGTAGFVKNLELSGDMPIRNFGSGRWEEGAARTCGQVFLEKGFKRNYGCFACPIMCGKVITVQSGQFSGHEGHSPEYETAAAFGGLCLNENPEAIIEANDLCNRLGLDTISTGGVIAFAMEAFEKGILTSEQTGGMDIRWGNPEAITSLAGMIARREGIGELLGEGVRSAAARLGKNAEEFAVETKGLEYAYHDPRAFPSMAINYATANRGACHLEGLTYFVENGAFPAEDIGFDGDLNRFNQERKAELAARMQDYMNVLNALGLCKFLVRGRVGPARVAGWVSLATGWDMDVGELLKAGERLHNIKRLYNNRLGISRKDDRLPLRLLTLDRGGGSAGSLPHWGKLISEYYRYRGWNEEGIPTHEKLKELDLVL